MLDHAANKRVGSVNRSTRWADKINGEPARFLYGDCVGPRGRARFVRSQQAATRSRLGYLSPFSAIGGNGLRDALRDGLQYFERSAAQRQPMTLRRTTPIPQLLGRVLSCPSLCVRSATLSDNRTLGRRTFNANEKCKNMIRYGCVAFGNMLASVIDGRSRGRRKRRRSTR